MIKSGESQNPSFIQSRAITLKIANFFWQTFFFGFSRTYPLENHSDKSYIVLSLKCNLFVKTIVGFVKYCDILTVI